MSLPPLADVYALVGASPDECLRQMHRLQQLGYRVTASTRPGALLAERPLPHSAALPSVVLEAGFAFAQGARQTLGDSLSPAGLDHLKALCRQPEALAERLSGDFGFVQLDALSGALLIVRSCGGLVPFYVWTHKGVTVVSTRSHELARVGGWRGEPDPLATALAINSYSVFPDHRAHLKGVHALEIGEACRVSPTGDLQWIRYWHPQELAPSKRPGKAEIDARQQAFRQILLDGLKTNLHPQHGNLISLSGGVDSASLTAVIRDRLHLPLACWSRTPRAADRFLLRETDFLRRIHQRYGIERHWEFPWSNEDLITALMSSPPSLAPPPLMTMLAAGSLLPAEARTTVVVGGEGADEVVGSHEFTLWDWAHTTPLWRCLLPGAAPRLRTGLRRWLRGRGFGHPEGAGALPLPDTLLPIFSPAIIEEYAAYFESTLARSRQLPALNRQTWLQFRLYDFQAGGWEAASDAGLRWYLPFRTREMLELSLSTHPSERLGRTTKLLMRGALQHDVEPDFLHRQDKGSFGGLEPKISKENISKTFLDIGMFPAFRNLIALDEKSGVDYGTFLALSILLIIAHRQTAAIQQGIS